MNKLRQTGVIFLVILVLVSTTGFTWWHHVCACKPVVEKVASCCEPVAETHSCCASEAPKPVSQDDACGTGCKNDHHGCKDIPVYFKASIVAIPQVQKVTLPELAAASVFVLPYIPETPGETANDGLTFSHDKPPPLSGKALVYFLNQLRIPFSV
jgi:hypothetical protein